MLGLESIFFRHGLARMALGLIQGRFKYLSPCWDWSPIFSEWGGGGLTKHIFMPLPPDIVGEDIACMFLGCPIVTSVYFSSQILLLWYLMNVLNSSARTDVNYLLARTDDLIWLWRSRSQQAIEVKSREHHISWITWANSMKLTEMLSSRLWSWSWDQNFGLGLGTCGLGSCDLGLVLEGSFSAVFKTDQ